MVKFWEKVRRTPSNREVKEKEADMDAYSPGNPDVIEVQGSLGPESECSSLNVSAKDSISLQGSQVSYLGSQLSYSGSQVSQGSASTMKGSSRDSSFDETSISSRSSKGKLKEKKKSKDKKKKGDFEMKDLEVGGVGLIPYPDMKETKEVRENAKGKGEKDKWVIHIDANRDKTALRSIQKDGKKRTTLERGSGLEKPGPEPVDVGKRSTIERGSGLSDAKGGMKGSKGSLKDSKTSLKKEKKKDKDLLKEREGPEVKEVTKKESKEEIKRREKEEREMKKREREEREREEKETKRREKEEEEYRKKMKEKQDKEDKEARKRDKEQQERDEKEAKKREKEEKKLRDKEKRNSRLFGSGEKREPLPTHPEENRWSLSEREKRAATLQAGVQPDVVFRKNKDKRFKDEKKRHSTSDFTKRRSRDFEKNLAPPVGFERFNKDDFRQRSSSLRTDAVPTRYLVHVRTSSQGHPVVPNKPSTPPEHQNVQVQPATSAKELHDPSNDFAMGFLHKNYLAPSKSSVSPRLAPLAPQASEESLNSNCSSQKKGKIGHGHLRNDSGSTITSSSSKSSGYSAMKPVPENPEIIRRKAYDKWAPECQQDDLTPCPKIQPSIPVVNPKVQMSFPEVKYSPEPNIKPVKYQVQIPKQISGSIAMKSQTSSPKAKSNLVRPNQSSPKTKTSVEPKKSSAEIIAKPKTEVTKVRGEVKISPPKESRIPKPHAKSPERKLEDSKRAPTPEPAVLAPQVQEQVFTPPPQSVLVLTKSLRFKGEPAKIAQPISQNVPTEPELAYNIPEIPNVNLNQMTAESKVQYDREKVTSTLTRTNKNVQTESSGDEKDISLDVPVDSVSSSTNSVAQGTPITSNTQEPDKTQGPFQDKVKNNFQSHIPQMAKDSGAKTKTRESVSVACDTSGAIETTFGADIELIDTDSSVEEQDFSRPSPQLRPPSPKDSGLPISPEERLPKFMPLEAEVQKESDEQMPKDAVRLENGGFTFASLPEPEIQQVRESPVKETTTITSIVDHDLEIDQKAPRKSSISQIKGAHQPDLVSNSIGSRAHAAQEITRLEALCEARTKELIYAKMQLKAGIQGFDAMSIMVQYLTSELDAFSMPELRESMQDMQAKMEFLTTDLDTMKVEKASLETMTHDLIQSHKETSESTNHEHRTQVDALEDRLGVKHEEHIQRLHDQHSEEVKTLTSYHDKHLSEIKTEQESASQELLKRERQQLREIEERDVRHLTELQKQHEAKLYEITHRFEDIKVTLSDKVYTLKAECDELRNRSQMYEQALQRDTDIKVQPGETVHDRLQKMIDEKARPLARISVDSDSEPGSPPIQSKPSLIDVDKRYILTPDFIGRRNSYALGESNIKKLALLPYRDLPQEIESLKTVLDMKNQEIHDLRSIKIDYEKQLEDLPPAKDRIKSLEQKIENLEAIINIKSDYEKQLAEKHHVLMRRYDRESKANKRLSMDKEELMWRLTEDLPEVLSPSPGKKLPVPCRSPSNLSEVGSPDHAGKRTRSPYGVALSPGGSVLSPSSEEYVPVLSKVPMRRSKSRTNEPLPSEKRTSNSFDDKSTHNYQTL